MKSNAESYQSMNMGPRNLLILFFSAVAVSLVILIILSSLVFKNLNLDFNTHMPESTPEIGRQFEGSSTMSPDSKADSVTRATLNVPPESVEPAAGSAGRDKAEPSMDTAPVSDDAVLENNSPLPLGDAIESEPPVATPAKSQASGSNTATKASGSTVRNARGIDASSMRPTAPVNSPVPVDSAEPDAGDSGAPPVPGQ